MHRLAYGDDVDEETQDAMLSMVDNPESDQDSGEDEEVLGEERRKAEEERRRKATLSEGVWKITYTYKNRDREIVTVTATWLLKEGRRGFAVKRMCTDGKFREKRWDKELVEDEDGKYFMLDSGVGQIRVENYQRV